ncbi:MAG: succinate dehydrogenase [Acidobacteria bacterium]|nr:MAG: succinate dehydrogenase [Acidobacteriota bacterium]
MAIKFSKTFLLRKLHQLTGIVPLGLFYFVHLYTNSAALNGPKVFNDHVQDIHNMAYLLFIEIFGIFIPLLFHSVYGILISAEAKPNVLGYGYARNWFYVFQRATGIFLFVFLLFHILNFRFGLIPGLNMTPVAGNADQAYAIVSREFQIVWVLIFYFLGVIATAWHLAYGFFLFAVDWGIVIGEKAQSILLKASLGLAVFLSLIGINAAIAFVRPCGLLPKALCEEPRLTTPTPPKKV